MNTPGDVKTLSYVVVLTQEAWLRWPNHAYTVFYSSLPLLQRAMWSYFSCGCDTAQLETLIQEENCIQHFSCGCDMGTVKTLIHEENCIQLDDMIL